MKLIEDWKDKAEALRQGLSLMDEIASPCCRERLKVKIETLLECSEELQSCLRDSGTISSKSSTL